MLTYALFDSVFIVAVGLVVAISWHHLPIRQLALLAFVLCIFTVIFDNLAIHFGFFFYNRKHISGILLGHAPIEDFAYPIAAALVMPYLWKRQK